MPTVISPGKAAPYKAGRVITTEDEILFMLRRDGLVGYVRDLLSMVGYDLVVVEETKK